MLKENEKEDDMLKLSGSEFLVCLLLLAAIICGVLFFNTDRGYFGLESMQPVAYDWSKFGRIK